MLQRLFPPQFDNAYRGSVFAMWLLIPIVLSKLFMGFNCAGLNPWISSRWVLEHADAIPIDAFSPEAVRIILFLFSAWGLALLVLSLLGILVLFRYRSMIPLTYLLLAMEQIGRRLLSAAYPIERASEVAGLSPGVLINWGFSIMLVVGLALSFLEQRKVARTRT